jgi:hypothetical protein
MVMATFIVADRPARQPYIPLTSRSDFEHQVARGIRQLVCPKASKMCRSALIHSMGVLARDLLIWVVERFGTFWVSGEIPASDQHADGQGEDGGCEEARG